MPEAKNDRLLKMIQQHYPAYHPIVSMVKMAHQTGLEDRLIFDCHKEIAKYVEPQLKAVEHKGSVKSDFGTLRVISSVQAPKALEDQSVNELLEFNVENKDGISASS